MLRFTNKFIAIALLLIIVTRLFRKYDIKLTQTKSTLLDKVLTNKDICVPRVKFSHPKLPDNNIPGILPGAIPGDLLGLSNNPDLSLREPIRAPIVDLPENMLNLHKYRKKTCCPYNGSYCQCTNNYLPIK